jgi:hypothetical protein
MPVETPRIFISYARADTEFVLKLAKELRSAGVNLWLDQLDIPAGARWDRAVEEALKACPCLLIVLSPASVASHNVMDEVSFALGVKKKIVPVRYRDCDIPFRLQRLQYIDFTVDYDNGFSRLLKALNVVQPSQTSPQHSTLTAPTFEQERQVAHAGAEEPKSQSWWETVPGILTALVGTITAVAGLVVALHQGGIFNKEEKKRDLQTQTSIESPREQVQQTKKLGQLAGSYEEAACYDEAAVNSLVVSLQKTTELYKSGLIDAFDLYKRRQMLLRDLLFLMARGSSTTEACLSQELELVGSLYKKELIDSYQWSRSKQFLLEHGEMGSFGILLRELDAELAKAFGLSHGQGAVIVDVLPNSPAQEAGLQTGDVIVAVNGQPVRDASAVRNEWERMQIRDKVSLDILRKGSFGAKERLTVTVTAQLPGE